MNLFFFFSKVYNITKFKILTNEIIDEDREGYCLLLHPFERAKGRSVLMQL